MDIKGGKSSSSSFENNNTDKVRNSFKTINLNAANVANTVYLTMDPVAGQILKFRLVSNGRNKQIVLYIPSMTNITQQSSKHIFFNTITVGEIPTVSKQNFQNAN